MKLDDQPKAFARQRAGERLTIALADDGAGDALRHHRVEELVSGRRDRRSARADSVQRCAVRRRDGGFDRLQERLNRQIFGVLCRNRRAAPSEPRDNRNAERERSAVRITGFYAGIHDAVPLT